MSDTFKLPPWPEFAKGIVDLYLDCVRRAEEAAAAGNPTESGEFAKLAGQFKRMMDKYQITIRYT